MSAMAIHLSACGDAILVVMGVSAAWASICLAIGWPARKEGYVARKGRVREIRGGVDGGEV